MSIRELTRFVMFSLACFVVRTFRPFMRRLLSWTREMVAGRSPTPFSWPARFQQIHCVRLSAPCSRARLLMLDSSTIHLPLRKSMVRLSYLYGGIDAMLIPNASGVSAASLFRYECQIWKSQAHGKNQAD